MRVLIVGAGAVGQVYGYHLQRSGAQVSVLVKPKYAAEAREGYRLFQHHLLLCQGSWVTFHPTHVLTSPEEVAQHTWDQVLLCMSATALRAGPWFDALAPALGESTVVGMTPGMLDREWLLERIPATRLVNGLITMISYQAPLPQQDMEPGVAYLLPPTAPNVFSGDNGIARPVVDALSRGGCPAKEIENAPLQGAFGSAIMMSHIAALQLDDWSLEGFRHSKNLERANAAAAQYLAIAAAYHKTTVPGSLKALRPWLMRLALGLAPSVMPFDLEIYIRYHFTKVADQTRALLAMNITWGQAHGLPTDAMQSILDELLVRDDAQRAQA